METSLSAASAQIDRKIYTGLPARAIKLLGTGCLPVEVARALGVSEGQVSQWRAEQSFQTQVNEEVQKNFKEQSVIDENYTKIEAKLSDRLYGLTEHMFNPDQVLRVLKFANEAKRKLAPNGHNGENGGSLTINAPVTIILPAQLEREFILNPNNEVVGINGQEVLTLPSKDITELIVIETKKKNSQNMQDPNLMALSNKVSKHNGSGNKDPWSNL